MSMDLSTSISSIIDGQRAFFRTGATLSYESRLDALKRLKASIIANEELLLDALEKDLRKTNYEGYMTELGLALDDLGHAMRNLSRWMRRRRVKTHLSQLPGSSFVVGEPYGVSLILAPWNYPVLLCLEPLTGTLSAGNTAVLKPSAYTPNVSSAIAKVVKDAFREDYVAVVEGGRDSNSALLENHFDYIFFTGSPTVGHLVMEKASRFLTPVSLELGGKSPVIVDASADLKLAARRIAFGKLVNAGQTCVAPDYLLIDEKVEKAFLGHLYDAILSFFPGRNYSEMPVIVNDRHFQRLTGLIAGQKVSFGGKSDPSTRFIEPTVVVDVKRDDPIMGEEIFGPILPVIAYKRIEEAYEEILSRPKPLALYLFSRDKQVQEHVTSSISYGGGCINDTLLHLSSPYLAFGGVGNSGMGSYHGKFSFDTFTHYKSILRKAAWPDLRLRYHPYAKSSIKLLKKLIK